jgi:hypothetical protein
MDHPRSQHRTRFKSVSFLLTYRVADGAFDMKETDGVETEAARRQTE